MGSRAWGLALVLTGCGVDGGAGDGGDGAGSEACLPHPNGAPCCPDGLTFTDADCPEGTTLRTESNDETTTTDCRNASGALDFAGAYVVTFNATGRTINFHTLGASFSTLCWPSTGYRKAILSGEGAAQCYSDCYKEDGAPASCAEVAPDVADCPD